jgi:hypothetical protein
MRGLIPNTDDTSTQMTSAAATDGEKVDDRRIPGEEGL